MVARGWEEGVRESNCSSVQGFFGGDENVLQLVVLVAQSQEYTKND